MAKITKAPKDEALEQRHSEFQAHADSMNGHAEPETEKTAEPTVSELLIQIGELKASQEAMREQNLALLTTPPQAQDILKPPGEVSYEGLPNPADDPAGYGRELNTRMQANWQAKQEYERKVSTNAQASNQRLDEVLEDIAIEYPEIGEDRDVLDFVAMQTVKAALKKGIDKERYVFGNRARFIQDVKKTFDAKFSRKDAEETERPGPGKGRSTSILGGHEGGRQQEERGREEPRPRETGFIKEMRDIQNKLGIF